MNFLFILSLWFCCLDTSAVGQTFYVSQSDSNGRGENAVHPWATLSYTLASLANVQGNVVIMIGDGVLPDHHFIFSKQTFQ